MSHRPRVMLGMAEVAGYFSNLQLGFAEIGLTCHFVRLTEHPYQYDGHYAIPRLSRLAGTLRRRLASQRRGSGPWFAYLGASGVVDCLVLSWALLHADAFVFAGTNSLLRRNLDLPILKALRKRVIFVLMGSDHRPPYLNGKFVRRAFGDGPIGSDADQTSVHDLVERALTMRAIVRRIEQRSDVVIAASASAQFHTRPFVHFLAVGVPSGPGGEAAGEFVTETDSAIFRGTGVRILHAPSDPAKGTSAFRQCVDQLRSSGLAIDYEEITGRPNHEVLAAIRRCDLVLDQAYSDAPLAVFATEAAHFGRPAVVGGYYADEILRDVAPALVPPSRFVHPDLLCEAIQRLATDKSERRRIGDAAQGFVREKWSRRAVAERYLRLISGDIPEAWIYDPQRLRYVHGWGLTADQVVAVLRRILRVAGPGGFALDHNPALQDRAIELAT